MRNPTLTDAIDALALRRDLSREQAGVVLREIMERNASEAGALVRLGVDRAVLASGEDGSTR